MIFAKKNESSMDLCICVFHGSDVNIFGLFSVSHIASPYLTHQRGNDKKVWNSASLNLEGAMNSVAGFSNVEEFMESGRSSAETILYWK